MDVETRCVCVRFNIDYYYYYNIRPLSDTVPLWSGSSYGAFVYIGNDGFCFATDCKRKRYNRKDKCRFFGFQKFKGIVQEVGTLKQVEFTYLHKCNRHCKQKAREPHCVIWQMS